MKRVKKNIIVGGSTAGWLSAGYTPSITDIPKVKHVPGPKLSPDKYAQILY